ncbi:MAG: S8 family serine peptidase, partial [Chitinophagaceae bacterium]
MIRGLALFILLLFGTTEITAQYSTYIIVFKDKKGTPYQLSLPQAYLSPRALQRRSRQKINVDSTDLPVSPDYIQQLVAISGVKFISASKWLNQALIQTTDSNALKAIYALPFVKSGNAVALQAAPRLPAPPSQKFSAPLPLLLPGEQPHQTLRQQQNTQQTVLNYGNNAEQIKLHHGEYLHNRGYTGEGMLIAIMDAGFYGYQTNRFLDSTRLQQRILGTWDFVAREASVSEDHPHGWYCLSIISANQPGEMIGTAPHASFYLFRTEDAATEYPVEEHHWVVAAEQADSLGADLISSSLGYSDFDDPSFDYSYAQRDGKTAVISRGATKAVEKGILVTNSAGNSGRALDDAKYVSCPADAEAVFAVGAVDPFGNIASFSSWGPNGAGLPKPDVVSVGQGTILIDGFGNVARGNGTSFSNPLLCGLMACLWQAFPEFTNREIMQVVKKSSSLSASPSYRFGYGIPDFQKAFEALEKEREIRIKRELLTDEKWIKAYPNPYTNQLNVILKAPQSGPVSLQVIDLMGRVLKTVSWQAR